MVQRTVLAKHAEEERLGNLRRPDMASSTAVDSVPGNYKEEDGLLLGYASGRDAAQMQSRFDAERDKEIGAAWEKSAPILQYEQQAGGVPYADGEASTEVLAVKKLPDLTAVAAPESRGRIMAYVHRLPLHVPFLGRGSNSARAALAGSADAGARERRASQASQEPSVASECTLEPSRSSFFGSDSALLKRVSSMPGNLSLFRAHLVDPLRHPEFHAPPRYTRNQPMRLLAHEPDNTPVYGYALLALTAALFVLAMYALVVSKFMPHTGVAFLDSVKDDRYFCLLMPMTGLSFVFAVFWNWLGMKFFRHN
ncbi:hypothetical protein GGI26_004334 [Coemansia sp. RSA 1358]|nr:hypothetical protein EDC05_003558 [Coemansia umbellata]KAJ2621166.1 hypothetical protein GGI26_004334 [Coemansia sp. RSA 1358]